MRVRWTRSRRAISSSPRIRRTFRIGVRSPTRAFCRRVAEPNSAHSCVAASFSAGRGNGRASWVGRMTIQSDAVSLRRLITAHTDDGKAYVAIDAEITNLKTGASGSTVRHVWNTRASPADIHIGAFDDPGSEPHITPPPPNGSRFAVIDFPPGNTGVMHRTESLDYVIVLDGEIDMDIDDESVHMK